MSLPILESEKVPPERWASVRAPFVASSCGSDEEIVRQKSDLQMRELLGDVNDAHVLHLLQDRDDESLRSIHRHADIVIAVDGHL
jgi:hypothetical protein